MRGVAVIALVLSGATGVATTPALARTVQARTNAANRTHRPRGQLASAVLHAENSSRVSGDARLSWSPKRQTLVVRVRLRHLAPKSHHAARIESGSCDDGGPTVHDLRDVVANEFGGGRGTTRLRPVDDINFATTDWHVTVYRDQSPDDGGDQAISCGDVRRSR